MAVVVKNRLIASVLVVEAAGGLALQQKIIVDQADSAEFVPRRSHRMTITGLGAIRRQWARNSMALSYAALG
jgi:hypothetical protein